MTGFLRRDAEFGEILFGRIFRNKNHRQFIPQFLMERQYFIDWRSIKIVANSSKVVYFQFGKKRLFRIVSNDSSLGIYTKWSVVYEPTKQMQFAERRS